MPLFQLNKRDHDAMPARKPREVTVGRTGIPGHVPSQSAGIAWTVGGLYDFARNGITWLLCVLEPRPSGPSKTDRTDCQLKA